MNWLKKKQKQYAKIATKQAAAFHLQNIKENASADISAADKENPPVKKKSKSKGKVKLFLKSKENKAKPKKGFTNYR